MNTTHEDLAQQQPPSAQAQTAGDTPLLSLSDEVVKRRLDAIAELSKNARTVLFILNFLAIYVIFSASTISPSEEFENVLQDAVNAYEKLTKTEGFDDAVSEADLPGWDFLRNAFGDAIVSRTLLSMSTVTRRNMALRDGKAVALSILEISSQNPEQLQIRCSATEDTLIVAACEFVQHLTSIDRHVGKLAEAPVVIDASPLKGTFEATSFIYISAAIISGIYLYLMVLIGEYFAMVRKIEELIGRDVAKFAVYPWIVAFAYYDGTWWKQILPALSVHLLTFVALSFLGGLHSNTLLAAMDPYTTDLVTLIFAAIVPFIGMSVYRRAAQPMVSTAIIFFAWCLPFMWAIL